jgi:hypothetical protein
MTPEHVRSPSGRSHAAGAERVWAVSKVMFNGLERVERSDEAVASNLLDCQHRGHNIHTDKVTLEYPGGLCVSAKTAIGSRAIYLEACCEVEGTDGGLI